MKVNEKELECKNCRYRNGYVCNICWKKTYEEFYERKEEENGEDSKRNTEKSKNY